MKSTRSKMPQWHALQKHFQATAHVHMRDLFAQDKNRAQRFCVDDGDFFIDYAKHRINQQTLELLFALADACELKKEIERLFNGDKINVTENRPVLHTALRNVSKTPVMVDGHDVMPDVFRVLDKMKKLSDRIRSGEWRGFGGKPLRHIVNIGIGGSDLGPCMAATALQFYGKRDLQVHFVSNIDGTHISETLHALDPEETLFIIASKTFTTEETMTNAHTARHWLLNYFENNSAVAAHFVAISTNLAAVTEFGIAADNMLEFWDWVGGRYSLTSAIGFAVMTAIGYDQFIALLEGFHAMDNHFRHTPWQQNMPVVMAMLGIWYGNFFGAQTHAILPYDQYLTRFPAYLQQADMESNGKSVDKHGNALTYASGPVIWGDVGTNGQHAFFQLLHQGSHLIPADFIGFIHPLNPIGNHHDRLMANFFAQTEALAFGKTAAEISKENIPEAQRPYRVFPGNRPSTTILIAKLTPYTLGKLIALYEHKIFVQGVVWNVLSFDQWGVELGKILAKKILPELDRYAQTATSHDSSTNSLINKYRALRHQTNEFQDKGI